MNSLGQRVQKIRKSKNMTQEEFANIIKSSKSNISRIEKDTIAPSSDILFQICNNFKVNGNWLITGIGDMDLNVNYKKDDIYTEIPVEEKILLNNYREMTDREREKLQTILIETRINQTTHDENILLEDFRDMSAEEQEQFKKVAAKILATDKDKKKISTSKNMEGEDIATKEDKIA